MSDRKKHSKMARANTKTMKNSGTNVYEIPELSKTLKTLASRDGYEKTQNLCNLINIINNTLDPLNLTMTSTNLPDAVTKLTLVMNQINHATLRVFELVEQQRALREELNLLTERFAQNLERPNVDCSLVKLFREEHQGICKKLKSIDQEILITQEFNDLSGQSIKKVSLLLESLNSNLTALLEAFGVNVALNTPGVLGDPDLNQSEMDELFGRISVDLKES